MTERSAGMTKKRKSKNDGKMRECKKEIPEFQKEIAEMMKGARNDRKRYQWRRIEGMKKEHMNDEERGCKRMTMSTEITERTR